MRITARLVGKKLFTPTGPLDAYFEALAKSNPRFLLRLVREGNMHSAALSFAVEALAGVPNNEGLGLLKERLKHPEGIVREGAIYGLKRMMSRRTVPGLLKEAIETEPHPALRDLIIDILNGEDDLDVDFDDEF